MLVNKACYVGRVPGIILLVLYAFYVAFLIVDAKKHPSCDDNIKALPLWKCILFIVLGLALVVGGGQKIARFLGMTETLIGLTIVAIGTSLPELVTSLVAAKKGDAALAIGNVIGSNIFNLMFILGFAAVINPLSVNTTSIYDLIVLTAANLMVWIMSLTKRRIGKAEGLVMILFYAAETVFAVLR